jgi:CMP-N-acetylneuraminic acid synthetase
MNIALIPVKKHSIRLPSKNVKKLGGKILLKYTLDTVSKCSIFDRIIISTDFAKELSIKYIDCSSKFSVIQRSPSICNNKSTNYDVCVEVAKRYSPLLNQHSTIHLFQVTSPFRRVQSLEKICSDFISSPYTSTATIRHLDRPHISTSDLSTSTPISAIQNEPISYITGSYYAFRIRETFSKGLFWGENPYLQVEPDDWLDIDINTVYDWNQALNVIRGY